MTTRREFVLASAAFAITPPQWASGTERMKSAPIELWYEKPATRWMEALPLGNGRIGAMVYGGVDVERLDLTESTIWSGAPSQNNIRESAHESLEHIRELMFAGKYTEAGELCKEHLLGRPESFGTHLPMATLELRFEAGKPVERYRRSLNLDEGIARVEYERDGAQFLRESFASNPAGILVSRVSSSEANGVNCSIGFAKLTLPGVVQSEGQDTLILKGHAFESLHSNGAEGVAFEVRVQVIAESGEITAGDGVVHVKNARAFAVAVAVSSNYKGADPSTVCALALKGIRGKTIKALQAAHVDDHQSLFRRVQIDLGRSRQEELHPTDQRRKAVQAGAKDPALSALFFQFGRYLTIAGSRADSPLPLALQGIWNDGLASSMGWTDDFHLDINTQQNYWLAEVGNLSECQSPLFNFLDSLKVAGRKTAREMYGAPGWVTHVVTNPWGFTAPGWGLGWGIFPTGGAWLALQLWEHYRFTEDKDFLRERVYPVYKEAAEFFLTYMVKHPQHGWLVTGPAVSPENWFISPEGKRCSESMGPTADRVLAYSLFSACVEASTLLNVDAEFRAKIQRALEQIPPLRVGKHGQLQEWLEDFDEGEPGHRHMSHLISLYPEHQISPRTTPELAAAARVTIQRRISQPNWEDSEWGRANLVNFYARLLDGEVAHKHYLGLIGNAAEDSLLTYSRGGVAGAESNIFSLDGNTAGAAGVAEMLLQSHLEEIHLLPALPTAWPRGRVTGLCARGGVEVEISWEDGRLITARLKSKRGGTCAVRYGGVVIQLDLVASRWTEIPSSRFKS